MDDASSGDSGQPKSSEEFLPLLEDQARVEMAGEAVLEEELELEPDLRFLFVAAFWGDHSPGQSPVASVAPESLFSSQLPHSSVGV